MSMEAFRAPAIYLLPIMSWSLLVEVIVVDRMPISNANSSDDTSQGDECFSMHTNMLRLRMLVKCWWRIEGKADAFLLDVIQPM